MQKKLFDYNLKKEEIYKCLINPALEMQSKSTYKVPNGKLLKIFLNYNEKNSVIYTLKITGDFFAYPEEAIEIIENKLKDSFLKKEILLEKINSIIKENHIEFIGLDAEGLSEGIMMCVK
jgi:small-conductance mechanosensitive channel